MTTVKEEDLEGAMKWIRELRRWAVKNNIDPWAVRQALVTALESDTIAALNRGIKKEDLLSFDSYIKRDVKEFMKFLKKGG